MSEQSVRTTPPAALRRVATLSELPLDRGVAVELDGETVLLVRDGDAVHALSGHCPHAKAPLAEGAVCEGRIICPWHKAEFAVADGALLQPPALGGLRRYPVEVTPDGGVLVSPTPLPVPAAPRRNGGVPGHVVVVGAGAAGTAAVAALREKGFNGRLTVVGAEPGEPYDRTALSKFVVAGKMPVEEVAPLLPEHLDAAHGIERLHAEVAVLDAAARRLTLSDGTSLAYDAALLATGSVPNRPDLPGMALGRVHALRDRADAAAILAAARRGGPAVLLGGGFIGLEVACGLREQGVPVTVVTPDAVPLARQLGPEVGAMLRRLHERHGVVFRSGKAARLEGEGDVAAVVLEDGTRIEAASVVLGLGVHPATALLRGVALDEDGGVPVDAALRAAPGLWAAGDLARFPLPDGRRVRVEHWRVAQQHGRIAAAAMLGEAAAYDDVPFFWTFHHGRRIECLGHPDGWDHMVVEGDLERQDLLALQVRGDAVVGVVACGRERQTGALIRHLRTPLPLAKARALIRAAA